MKTRILTLVTFALLTAGGVFAQTPAPTKASIAAERVAFRAHIKAERDALKPEAQKLKDQRAAIKAEAATFADHIRSEKDLLAKETGK